MFDQTAILTWYYGDQISSHIVFLVGLLYVISWPGLCAGANAGES